MRMADDRLLCDILSKLSSVINMIENQAHDLRALRQIMEERLEKPMKPKVTRMPWYSEPHDLGMKEARTRDGE